MKVITALVVLILLTSILIIRISDQQNTSQKTETEEPLEQSPGTEDNPYAASKFRYEMVTGKISDSDPGIMRREAVKYSEDKLSEYRTQSSMPANPWITRGPTNTTIGGRVRSILIKPTQNNVILCGAVSGGVWKSTNSGTTWVPRLDAENPVSISTLLIDPLNPDIVYAGTGEGWVDLYGGGIYKSTNFGDTWTLLPATSGSEASKFRNVKKMASDNIGNIYAATNDNRYKDGLNNFSFDGGLYRSPDQGNSWIKISSTDISTNYYNPCDVIAIDPMNIIYAVGEYFYNQGIYRTSDGGVSWTHITAGLPASGYDRIALAKDPNQTNVIYAAIHSTDYSSGGDGGLKGIYKSNDSGYTWTALPKPPPLVSTGNKSYMRDQGWYDNVIAVDPYNSQNIYLGGVDLMKSTNGGLTWFQLTYWDNYYGTPVVHADHHAIVFDPLVNGTIYDGCDGGIYRSTDYGAHWNSRNTNLQIAQFYSGAVFPTGSILWGGTQDNGHLKTFSSGPTWDISFGGDGGYSAQHQQDPFMAFEEYVYLDMRKTVDMGLNWSSCLNGLSDAGDPYKCLFIAPFAMNPEKSDVLLAGSDKVWMTDDAAENWTQVSYTFYSGQVVSAVTVCNDAVDYMCFAGTTNGRIYKSNNLDITNGTGNSWYDITPPGNNGAYVRRITVDPVNKNRIYACYSGYNPSGILSSRHVYFSPDQGITWIDISYNLPNVPVHSLVLDTTNSPLTPVIYIGTETGIYNSTDNGLIWQIFSVSPMPSYVPVDELVIQSATKKLIAFTYGRGAWETQLDSRITSVILRTVMEGYYNAATNQAKRRDTLSLYAREVSFPYTIVDSGKAVLDTIFLTADYAFSKVTTGTYYFVVKHRNCIETWTKAGGTLVTQGQTKNIALFGNINEAYGSNMKLVDNVPVRYAIYSGDCNQDQIIDAGDVSMIENDASASAGGYIVSDLTGDEYVDADDLSIVENNASASIYVISP